MILITRPASRKPRRLNFFIEESHPRPRRARHFRQRGLGDPWQHRLWRVLPAIAGQQQQGARQPLFSVIEELVHQILFDAGVGAEKVGNEPVGASPGCSWSSRSISLLLRTTMVLGVTAVALPIRRGCPDMQPSPKKSPGPSIATTTSRPVFERTESFTPPFWMYITVLQASPCEKMSSVRR